jgi:hypothetical protein
LGVHSTSSNESHSEIEAVVPGEEFASTGTSPVAGLFGGTVASIEDVISSEAVSAEPIDLRMDADFDEVCERLDELLPEVSDESGWDSDSLHEAVTIESNDSSFASKPTIGTEDGSRDPSMEDQLGSDVCQLVEHLQQTFGLPQRENSPAEQLRSLLSPAVDEGVGSTDTVETGSDSSTEYAHATTIETSQPITSPASSRQGADRPYRNLFSMLRRKQQGLL